MPNIKYNKAFSLAIIACLASLVLSHAQSKFINSGWQFSENKTAWETVNIPHTWNTEGAFEYQPGYRRGLGYYQKQVFIPSENIYNFSGSEPQADTKKQRIFDAYVNDILLEKQLNLAKVYPENYDIKLTSKLQIKHNKGLTISLKAIEGQSVISGILIEKLN